MPFPKQPDPPTSPSNSSNDSIAQDIALNLAYFGVSFIPVIGSTVALAELLNAMANNVDIFGNEVDNVDKMIMAMGVLLPHVSKVPGVKNTLKAMIDYLKKGGVPAKNVLLKIFKKSEGAIVKLFADAEKGASHGLNIFEDLGGEFLESAGEIVESAVSFGYKTSEQVYIFIDSFKRIVGNKIGAIGNIAEISRASSELIKKADYILGKASGSAHNIERSKSMLRQMERIGLPDNPQTRELLKDHLVKTLRDPNTVKDVNLRGGRVFRESLISGRNGHLKMETIWEGDKLIAVRLKGGS